MTKTFIFSFLAICLLTACASFQKAGDCYNFKTGRFELHSEFDNSTSIINRNDSIQIETNTTTGQIVKAKIRWTGKCEYELTYLGETLNSADTIVAFIKSRTLKTKILKATKDYYIFESSMEGISKTLIDTLRLIR